MTTTTSPASIPNAWIRAMARAADNHLQALRINDRTYAVRSVSHPGSQHLVTVNERGKIESCDCKGFEHGHICMHCGCVARRLLRERAITIRQPAQEPLNLPQPASRGKSQIFQEEVA